MNKLNASTLPPLSDDYWKPVYHIAPPSGWMNDPNGFIYYKGAYHLFYQYHPHSPKWGPMHWGHVKSLDLAVWAHQPIALAPGEEYDRDGCFSGSAIEHDGKLYLLYTGNQWTGPNQDTDLKQEQNLAVSEDGVSFEKWPGNPVLPAAPEGDIHPHHFRDPKVWRQGGLYYCVLGSRTRDHHGQALLYRSADLQQWEFVRVTATSNGKLGYMWECPDFFQLGGQDILIFSPQGVEPEGHKYHNLHQAGYLAGKLNLETGELTHGDFQLLDHGFDFYAPQTTVTPDGRRMMIAWMAMWESPMPEQERGWAGAMTLPRELTLHEDGLHTRPAAELIWLRGEATEYADVLLPHAEVELSGVEGDCYELEVVIAAGSARTFGLKVRAGTPGQEETWIGYDQESGMLFLDREHSGSGPGGKREVPVALIDGCLHLRIFVDRSSVELFAQDGRYAMSARVYPDEASRGVRFYATGGDASLVEVRKWELKRGI